MSAGNSISWNLQPNKKSLNLGVFKHPGTKGGISPNLPASATFEAPSTPLLTEDEGQKAKRSQGKNEASDVREKLETSGLKCVLWVGKCEADKVSTGRYDVAEGASGMYGIVLDNTFSKTVAKTATFTVFTHPTEAPPRSAAQLRYRQSVSGGSSNATVRPSYSTTTSESAGSHTTESATPVPQLKLPKDRGIGLGGGDFYTGVMHKKRRKRNQGYARRFFSLDFSTSTLSYYRNSHSSALRGAVPLSLAVIVINEKNREFSIDSGAEVWHLRLRNRKDFEGWRTALNHASHSPVAEASPRVSQDVSATGPAHATSRDLIAEREWQRVEELVSRVSGTRDAVRRLAQDTDPKYNANTNGFGSQVSGSPSASSVELNPFAQEMEGKQGERKPFWKRKPSSSAQGGSSPSGLFRRTSSAQYATSTPSIHTPTSPMPVSITRKSPMPTYNAGDEVHDRCMAILRDLDATVSEFSSLLAQSKARRRPPLAVSESRASLDSVRSGDFFDAQEGNESSNQMLPLIDSSETDDEKDFVSDENSDVSSEAGDVSIGLIQDETSTSGPSLFPCRPKQLLPKEVPLMQGRASIPPPKQAPPSIIGFLRKNAGKDLSTVAMPVSANEPTSLLQKLAEPMEAARLLSTAASSSFSGPDLVIDRLLYVAAFAVSSFSSNRVKERAIRKPFNPMLGETYELLRHESPSSQAPAWRFIAEKVSHHPVRMAWQADSLTGDWSMSQSPQPVQKFWGKSVELNTEGKSRLSLHTAQSSTSAGKGEHYTWTQATCFLRNVIAGEKYVEPVQSMTIFNETTGHKAVASFKASGMFSGRSEEVTVALYAPNSTQPLATGLSGRWTTELTRTDTGETIWEAGSLVPDAAKVYGFTTFAAGLNEITEVENDRLPPTDSRLRPDQRELEGGQLDKAEALKARLEERQRARRKVSEAHGKSYIPLFFEKADEQTTDDTIDGQHPPEVWKLKSGKDGYWQRRERRDWSGIAEVFEV